MYKFSIKCACTFLFFFFSATNSNAQIVIEKYNVRGTDFDALITSIDKNGPDGSWGRTTHDWAVSYTLTVQNSMHKVTKVKVSHATKIEMPEWRDYASASECMKSSWDDMYRKLKKHEERHAELGSEVAEKIRQSLLSIPPQDSKGALELLVNQSNIKVFEGNQKVQEKYDSNTDHGRNAGIDSIVLKQC